MLGARRQIKLPYTEKHIRCPHCHADIVFGTVIETIQMSRRICPKCGKEFLIENDVPKKPAGSVTKNAPVKRKSR